MILIGNDDEYRESMIGADVLSSASPRYFEVSVMIDLGVTPAEWEAMSLCSRAELIVAKRLNNMVEILERHISEQNRKQREMQKKSVAQDKVSKRGKV